MYLENWLGDRGYDIYQIISDENYARRSVLTEWLRDQNYDPESILAYEDTKTIEVDQPARDAAAVNACLRHWMRDLEVDLEGFSDEEVKEKSAEVSLATGQPIPILGKQILRDGKEGDPYDQPVTVGVMTMLKLHHLVEDKVHQRALLAHTAWYLSSHWAERRSSVDSVSERWKCGRLKLMALPILCRKCSL